MTFPTVGKLAPGFTLVNQHGEKISLNDFKGKKNVVLYFYPKASTPGCTTQACGLRDGASELAALDTEVLGLSPDPQARLFKFAEKYDLNFNLLADEDHVVAEKYGVWGLKKFMGREFMGILRTTFLINKKGELCYAMHRVNTKTHYYDVITYIKEHFKD